MARSKGADAHGAAALAQLERPVEGVDAMFVDVVLDRARLGREHAHALLVMPLDALEQLEGLARQAARVDGGDVDARDVGPDQVGEHDRLGAQAAGIDDPAMLRDRALQQFDAVGHPGPHGRVECGTEGCAGCRPGGRGGGAWGGSHAGHYPGPAHNPGA